MLSNPRDRIAAVRSSLQCFAHIYSSIAQVFLSLSATLSLHTMSVSVSSQNQAIQARGAASVSLVFSLTDGITYWRITDVKRTKFTTSSSITETLSTILTRSPSLLFTILWAMGLWHYAVRWDALLRQSLSSKLTPSRINHSLCQSTLPSISHWSGGAMLKLSKSNAESGKNWEDFLRPVV